MITNTEYENGKVIVTYDLSPQDIEVLKHIKEHGYMEFRKGNKSQLGDNLYDYGFVTSNDDAWHLTFVLTELGKQVAKHF